MVGPWERGVGEVRGSDIVSENSNRNGSWVLVCQDRKDAIGIYTRMLIKHLPTDVSVVEVKSSFTGLRVVDRVLNVLHALWLWPSLVSKRSVFVDPKTIEAILVFVLRKRAVVIFHHHDIEPPFFRFLPGVSLGRLLQCAKHVVAISGAARDQAIQLGVDEQMVSTCYSGVDRSVFRPRTRNRKCLTRYVLHVGSDIPRKNTIRLLKAFAILAREFEDLHLVKVGSDRQNRARMVELVAELGLNERVVFLENLSGDALAELYAGAECLVFPSLLEGFGFPVVEAMACGCPVVTSDRDPMRELVGCTQVLCDPESIDAILTACRRVLSDEALRAAMAADGVRQAEKFSWARTASEIDSLVRRGS